MPVAIPIIAVAVGAVASAAVGGGIIGALVGAGTAFAITSVGGSVFPSRPPSSPAIPSRAVDNTTAPGAGRTQSFRQPLTEHQLVFGRIKVGGPMVFIHSATDDQGRADGYFYTVIVLAAHRVQSIGDVWLGDTLATDAKFAGLVRIDRHLGAADQVANANLIAETGGKWTANHRGRGRAYVAVRIKITAQAFPSGPPNIAALVQGANKKFAVIPPGTWRVDAGVVLGGGARGLIMQGVIQYTGATNAPATVLTLGDGGTTRNGEKLYLGLQSYPAVPHYLRAAER